MVEGPSCGGSWLLLTSNSAMGRGLCYASSTLASISLPVLPQLKTKKKSLGRFILCPNMASPALCIAALIPTIPVSWAQISTAGSVKPFFPSFTSTGFSVRVCHTRICVPRHETMWGRSPASPHHPLSPSHSPSISHAPPILALFHLDFLHCC